MLTAEKELLYNVEELQETFSKVVATLREKSERQKDDSQVLEVLDVLLCSVINIEVLDSEGIEDIKLVSSHFGLRGVIEKLKSV